MSDRVRFSDQAALEEAATRFVESLGSATADLLIRNVRYTAVQSDALRALLDALTMDAHWRATSPDTSPVHWSHEEDSE